MPSARGYWSAFAIPTRVSDRCESVTNCPWSTIGEADEFAASTSVFIAPRVI
jgi:hypothetical protein